MKPVFLKFQCFGPYMAEQTIDFAALQKNGLFLISGETGAGKTTILDAMCYALYGKSSGGLRGDLSVMRCKLTGKDDVTQVEFVFDAAGKRYQFTRTLKMGRKNLNDSHNCLVQEGEVFVPIFENPKATNVNAKAQELIGLTYDQFRQVIILPQGQFEKLLVSNSEEKEKILVSLFHADRWQRISEELYRRVAEQSKALDEEKGLMAAKLREYGCISLGQLEEKQLAQTQSNAQLAQQSREAEAALASCREAKEAALLECQAFEALAQGEAALADLENQAAHYRQEEAVLALADKAEGIRPQHQAFQTAKTEKLRAEGTLAQAEDGVTSAGEALTAAQSAWDTHQAGRETQDGRRERRLLLENARELYKTLKEKETAAKNAKNALHSAEKAQKQAEKAYTVKDKAWLQAIAAQNRAMEDYQSAQAAYLRGIGGTLARQLISGQPCPVCGSREHPSPAPLAEGHITEEALEAKNRAAQEAGEAVSAAFSERSEAEAAREAARKACTIAANAEAQARSALENALAQRQEGIDTEAQLKKAISGLDAAIRDFEAAETRLSQALEAAKAAAIAARSKQDTAREALTAAQTRFAAQALQWEQALTGAGLTEEGYLTADMTHADKQIRRTALIGFRKELEQARAQTARQRQALAGRTAPDKKALEAALTQAEALAKGLSRQHILAKSTLEAISQTLADLQKRQAAYTTRRTAVDADLDFANRLRGRSGVSLQRYVLGVMLTSITTEANRLLQNVYAGRYQLYRTNAIAGSGHKGGLELEVWDSQTNARRSVTTLSGGEKFLVALSLAIGLSTVVQAQGGGLRLEAMFVDEGFGSLDADSIQDALEVLQGIQRSAGLVGIISHVEALAETIPTRLEIVKGSRGSSLRLRG